MRWEIKATITAKSQKDRLDQIIKTILKNRQLTTQKDIKNFLYPPDPRTFTPKAVGIDPKALAKALQRISKAVENQESIVIYGDYDADGICATAIMWETLHAASTTVYPFIPDRKLHGYGLSIKGIQDILNNPKFSAQDSPPSLIITVDNGIVAQEAAEFAKEQGIDLIISDHHLPAKTVPKALAIIHTTELAGSGVAWVFAKEIATKLAIGNSPLLISSTLDLATIGTVADLVPLKDHNRALVKWGFEQLQKTTRAGLQAIFHETAVKPEDLTTYHINFIIAPRLNAMGRLEHGLDSLRLLCTRNPNRAIKLAQTLGDTNLTRQELTQQLLEKALAAIGTPQDKLIIIDHQDFHEGVIGLVAGKIVETHYRPAIVIGRGETISKASARSVAGVNIIELIRKNEHLLVNAGGHPMAAGFTIETAKIEAFKQLTITISNQTITDESLKPLLTIDAAIKPEDISWGLFNELEKLKPFGMGNPTPVFALQSIKPLEVTTVGADGKHLKIILPSPIKQQSTLPALWFNHGERAEQLTGTINLTFTLEENHWNGKRDLQLKIRDMV